MLIAVPRPGFMLELTTLFLEVGAWGFLDLIGRIGCVEVGISCELKRERVRIRGEVTLASDKSKEPSLRIFK
jgi:hypothetical protein